MSEETKACPVCGEQILVVARKCRYCGEYLDPSARPKQPAPGLAERMVIPVGRTPLAITAGYLGLLSLFPLLGIATGILAVVCGVMALKQIKADPALFGKGRAWFGIVLGALMAVLQVVFILSVTLQYRR